MVCLQCSRNLSCSPTVVLTGPVPASPRACVRLARSCRRSRCRASDRAGTVRRRASVGRHPAPCRMPGRPSSTRGGAAGLVG